MGHQVGFLSPDEALRQAVVRYRDDDDLRDMIDVIQTEVRSKVVICKERGVYIIMFYFMPLVKHQGASSAQMTLYRRPLSGAITGTCRAQ